MEWISYLEETENGKIIIWGTGRQIRAASWQAEHLPCRIDRQAQERFERLIEGMKRTQGITEQLKAENALEWTGKIQKFRFGLKSKLWRNPNFLMQILYLRRFLIEKFGFYISLDFRTAQQYKDKKIFFEHWGKCFRLYGNHKTGFWCYGAYAGCSYRKTHNRGHHACECGKEKKRC